MRACCRSRVTIDADTSIMEAGEAGEEGVGREGAGGKNRGTEGGEEGIAGQETR